MIGINPWTKFLAAICTLFAHPVHAGDFKDSNEQVSGTNIGDLNRIRLGTVRGQGRGDNRCTVCTDWGPFVEDVLLSMHLCSENIK